MVLIAEYEPKVTVPLTIPPLARRDALEVIVTASDVPFVDVQASMVPPFMIMLLLSISTPPPAFALQPRIMALPLIEKLLVENTPPPEVFELQFSIVPPFMVKVALLAKYTPPPP